MGEYSAENFDLDNLTAADLLAKVKSLHLCALRNEHNEGDETGQPPTNHWALCLEIPNKSSVMFDMAPGYGSDCLRGKVELSSLKETYTEETLRVFTFKPIRSMIVDNLKRFTTEKGRDAFNFSPEWESCRHWMSVVMKDLEDAGWVERGSAKRAREALLRYWRSQEGDEPRVKREGTFRSE
ncbi:hypothetical protein B0H67DRAFT_484689 [Lasiosphaeris hirsuta]|uniref:DUF7770 domain-containing protein n=1 Tax=Lasiosphaeris hirsuta TaxID=260670 RepID=A0AA40E1M7_9PEZI|nr:hypothetical protein B0H67DRAFT_484689 [Lasiosphaeris hirsuta]